MENLWHIEEFIPYGAKNAIKRQDLVQIIGLCDRTVRELIENARKSEN